MRGRGGEDISDRKLVMFLLLAVFISIISVWSVFIAVDFDLLGGGSVTTITIKEGPPPAPNNAVVGFTINPNPENYELFGNGTGEP
ncbi:MAG: hypothetical protein ABIB47_02635 [Candidatus Woesearchaeota archaeon]